MMTDLRPIRGFARNAEITKLSSMLVETKAVTARTTVAGYDDILTNRVLPDGRTLWLTRGRRQIHTVA